MELKVALLAIGLLGLGVAGLAIKVLLTKDKQLSGTCASQNPLVSGDAGGSCSVCGARPSEQCKADASA
jgi:hypothetical protein